MPGETENKETAKTSDEEKRPFSFRTEAQEEESTGSKTEGEEKEHDPYYPPVITLPEVSKLGLLSRLCAHMQLPKRAIKFRFWSSEM